MTKDFRKRVRHVLKGGYLTKQGRIGEDMTKGEENIVLNERDELIQTIEAQQQMIFEANKQIQAQQQEIDRLKEKLNAVLQDFYQYVQGGKEICAFCLHDYECEPGETICGATYKGFKWRGLNEREDLWLV